MVTRAEFARSWRPCKIGTMPALVRVHGSAKIEPNKWIRIQTGLGANWIKVLVREVQPDGYFQADR